jgi:hypothetical protein
MATAKPNGEHETVTEVDHVELLRVLTFERFSVWKPPARVPDRAAPGDHARSDAASVSIVDATNVRGRVHDAKNSNTHGRTR